MTMTVTNAIVGGGADAAIYTRYESANITDEPDLSGFSLQDLINPEGN